MAGTGIFRHPASLLAFVAVISFSAVGLALLSQYRFDMQPCPWCTLQRLIFLLVGGLAMLGLVLPSSGVRRVLALGALLLTACGVAAALWQQFVAAKSVSCNLTLADRILKSLGLFDLAPDVFAPTASCAEAAVNLFGIPYALWSCALFVLLGVGCLQVIRVTRL